MASDTKKIVSLPGNFLPGLGVASTASLGQRLDGSRNEIWLCPAYAANAQGLMLFVKPSLSRRAMFVEMLAAQLGQCLKLPCPSPYLTTVDPVHVGRPRGAKPIVAFGSESVSERALSRTVKNLDALMQILERLKLSESVASFDEWIGNSVRSPTDIIFDPEGRAYLIDHECAMADALKPDEQIGNWVALQLIQRVKPAERPALLRALRARVAAAHRARLEPVPAAVQYAQDGIAIYTSLIDFLQQRLQHLDQLLSQRVLPGQMHINQAIEDHDSDRAAEL